MEKNQFALGKKISKKIQVTWFHRGGNFLSHIEVLDIKEKNKGFK